MIGTVIAESTITPDHVIIDMPRQTRDMLLTWFTSSDSYKPERVQSILDASEETKQSTEVYATPADLFSSRDK